MKKRLFTMLLLLCLLLTALTATVAAESTNANGGHLEFTFNGRTVTFVLSFNYVCENKHNTHDGYFTYNLNSVQAKKADGTIGFDGRMETGRHHLCRHYRFRNSLLCLR